MNTITKQQIAIFAKYGGETDGIARVGSSLEKTTINDSIWREITAFCQRIVLLERGLLSESAAEKLKEDLDIAVPDEEARRHLFAVAHSLQ